MYESLGEKRERKQEWRTVENESESAVNGSNKKKGNAIGTRWSLQINNKDKLEEVRIEWLGDG